MSTVRRDQAVDKLTLAHRGLTNERLKTQRLPKDLASAHAEKASGELMFGGCTVHDGHPQTYYVKEAYAIDPRWATCCAIGHDNNAYGAEIHSDRSAYPSE